MIPVVRAGTGGEGGTDPFDPGRERLRGAPPERDAHMALAPAPNAEPGRTATCASSRQKSANSRSSMPVPTTSGKQKSPASGTGQRMPGIASRPRATRSRLSPSPDRIPARIPVPPPSGAPSATVAARWATTLAQVTRCWCTLSMFATRAGVPCT